MILSIKCIYFTADLNLFNLMNFLKSNFREKFAKMGPPQIFSKTDPCGVMTEIVGRNVIFTKKHIQLHIRNAIFLPDIQLRISCNQVIHHAAKYLFYYSFMLFVKRKMTSYTVKMRSSHQN